MQIACSCTGRSMTLRRGGEEGAGVANGEDWIRDLQATAIGELPPG
jgi:hypothetical protein